MDASNRAGINAISNALAGIGQNRMRHSVLSQCSLLKESADEPDSAFSSLTGMAVRMKNEEWGMRAVRESRTSREAHSMKGKVSISGVPSAPTQAI
jgi:hypothetical protein